ncbi:hypothetical protein H4R35_001503, partial [Dimargaris xerosporica]
FFAKLRYHLDLPNVKGSPTLVGLHTLIDGAVIEYRALTLKVSNYLKPSATNSLFGQNTYEEMYPDLFQKYKFRELDQEALVMLPAESGCERLYPNGISHSLANLGLTFKTKYLVTVVEMLFDILSELDLLENFQSMVNSASQGQQAGQNKETASQTSIEAAGTIVKSSRALMSQFWLKVINGNDSKMLRYYLCNMLAFDVIPRMIGQVLVSDTRGDKALKLAKQLRQIDGIKQVVKDYDVNAPNYFEFIMLFATRRGLKKYPALAAKAKRQGKVNAQLWYDCYESIYSPNPLHAWQSIFKLQPFTGTSSWSSEDHARCNALPHKYMRSLDFSDMPTVVVYS